MEKSKLALLLSKIFGWGIFCVTVAGALSFFGFLTALAIGGDSGQALAIFVQKKYFPIVIRFTSAMIFVGLIAMYAGKEQALSLVTDKQEADREIAAAKH